MHFSRNRFVSVCSSPVSKRENGTCPPVRNARLKMLNAYRLRSLTASETFLRYTDNNNYPQTPGTSFSPKSFCFFRVEFPLATGLRFRKSRSLTRGGGGAGRSPVIPSSRGGTRDPRSYRNAQTVNGGPAIGFWSCIMREHE